jgi:hypothetical protein
MAEITLLPSSKVPLVYEGENTMTTEWYRFFWNSYGFTATGVVPVSKGGTGLNTIGDHQFIIGNANNVFEPTTLVGSGITITYGTGTVTLAIGNSGVTPGTYGTASSVGQFTVDTKGTLTFAQNVAIAIDANQITSGTLVTVRGGTGLSTFVANQIFYAGSTSTIDQSNKLLFDGNVLTSTGGIGGGNF